MLKEIKHYILYLRPLSFPIVFLHLISGLIIGYSINSHPNLDYFKIILGIISWVILLNGATLAINSYYDKDKQGTSWLEKIPPLPQHLHIFSYILFITGAIISFFVNTRFFAAYIICFVLSILYSVPPFRWKNILGLDIIINAIGYGALTMYAGYALLDVALRPTMMIILIWIAVILASGYPLSQFRHIKEDKKKGIKNLTTTLGKRGCLIYSLVLSFLVSIIFIISFILGYFPTRTLIMIPLYIIGLIYLLNWYFNYNKINEKREMYIGYFLGSMLDIFLIISFL